MVPIRSGSPDILCLIIIFRHYFACSSYCKRCYISVSPDQDIGRQVSQLVRLLQDLFGALFVHADLCANAFNRYPKHWSRITEATFLHVRLERIIENIMQVPILMSKHNRLMLRSACVASESRMCQKRNLLLHNRHCATTIIPPISEYLILLAHALRYYVRLDPSHHHRISFETIIVLDTAVWCSIVGIHHSWFSSQSYQCKLSRRFRPSIQFQKSP